ncbi:ABC-type multidrug transport system, ATPase component [Lunatimonas lonarensis]|uniref:ABC-type multidrug transport system, ATPase component n=1 Tax=Lunatimonas lonarensis TaxID=1232681 RepID=R7ZKY0_9BACT|nr:ABC transporter ATP-binding protein [Lunatimonas lonarensis]EON74732.1 ABC-type multidrug transport system, ATPase component [Lunatimonas lonarensis]
MEPVIQLSKLSKSYGTFKAVDSLDLEIHKGEIVGLLGPNGAGKSTTILMMIGLTEPSSGRAIVCGHDATKEPVAVKTKVGYLPEDVGFYDELTGRENLLFTARLNRISEQDARRRVDGLLRTVGLEAAADKRVKTYSRGMRQRLGLADVLIKDPEVIVLDEPTLGIDPKGVKELLSLITELARTKGLTVLLSSHHLHQVQQVCDWVGLFVSGKLIAKGTVEELSAQLFSQYRFQIQAKVSLGDFVYPQELEQALLKVDGIKKVTWSTEGELEIGWEKELSSEIARVILDTGASLHQLTHTTYGLDDIYQRYFEEKDAYEMAK